MSWPVIILSEHKDVFTRCGLKELGIVHTTNAGNGPSSPKPDFRDMVSICLLEARDAILTHNGHDAVSINNKDDYILLLPLARGLNHCGGAAVLSFSRLPVSAASAIQTRRLRVLVIAKPSGVASAGRR